MGNEKTCFVICPIGDEGTETRKWSDLTFKYIIKPVAENFGYTPIRADHIKESGMITYQIIDQLLESDLIIADLTSSNPNVYYELAIRHFIQKPCIQMIKCGQKIPFDINGMRTVFYDVDLELAEVAKSELSDHIKSINEGEFKATNPITLAHNHSIIQKALQESKQELKEDGLSNAIIESIANMTNSILELKMDISFLKNQACQTNETKIQNREKVELSNQFSNLIKQCESCVNSLHYLEENIVDIEGKIKEDNSPLLDENRNNMKKLLLERRELQNNIELLGVKIKHYASEIQKSFET
ncbi:MAG: hypothetical protein AAGU10_15140 [Methanosarcina mazei]